MWVSVCVTGVSVLCVVPINGTLRITGVLRCVLRCGFVLWCVYGCVAVCVAVWVCVVVCVAVCVAVYVLEETRCMFLP
jgi:hypothetical protein